MSLLFFFFELAYLTYHSGHPPANCIFTTPASDIIVLWLLLRCHAKMKIAHLKVLSV